MLTPTIKDIDKRDGQIRLNVSFSDGTNTYNDVLFLTSLDDIKSILSNRANQLESLYSTPISLGVFDTTPTPLPPSDVQKAQFFVDYNNWVQIKGLIDSGILTGNEQFATDLKTKVQSEFKVEYFNL